MQQRLIGMLDQWPWPLLRVLGKPLVAVPLTGSQNSDKHGGAMR